MSTRSLICEELDNGKTFLFSTNAENGSYPGINGAKREGT